MKTLGDPRLIDTRARDMKCWRPGVIYHARNPSLRPKLGDPVFIHETTLNVEKLGEQGLLYAKHLATRLLYYREGETYRNGTEIWGEREIKPFSGYGN